MKPGEKALKGYSISIRGDGVREGKKEGKQEIAKIEMLLKGMDIEFN